MFMRSTVQRMVLFVGLIILISAHAGMSPEDEVEYEKEVSARKAKAIANIPRLVRLYGEAIGCSFGMQRSNVVPYNIDQRGEYVALFTIDQGCSGGSAMSRPVIVVLRWGEGEQLFIDIDRSVPKMADALPGGADKIFVRGSDLRFSGVESWWDHRRVAGKLTWSDGASRWLTGKQ